jgi:hypothetical protein
MSAGAPPRDPLLEALALDRVAIDPRIIAASAADETGGDISTGETVSRVMGLARLLFAKNSQTVEDRLPALLAALRALQQDSTFDRAVETYTEYQRAAQDLVMGEFEYVVFGHTHAARNVWLTGGSRYLNCGTWADLMKFPKEVVSGPEPQALDALRALLTDMQTGKLAAWTSFVPTYVRLDFDAEGHVVTADLCDYSPAALP